MMEDVQGHTSSPTDELDNGMGDGFDVGLDDRPPDIIEDDEESTSATEDGDDVPIELSADIAESSENGGEEGDQDSFASDEEQLPLDDAASWERERLEALAGTNFLALIVFANT